MPTKDQVPEFKFYSPTRSIQTHGVRQWLATDWDSTQPAASIASLSKQAAGRFIVGAIPFDISQPPALFEPESISEVAEEPSGQSHAEAGSLLAEDETLNEQRAQSFIERTAAALTALDDPQHPLEKVVLGRLASWQHADGSDFDAQQVFQNLCAQNPHTYRFYFSGIPARYTAAAQLTDTSAPPSTAVLTGASPELVLQVADQQLETYPMAGSLSSSAAQALQAQGDATVLDALYTPKNQAEHAHVIRDIAQVLEPYCADLEVPATPNIVRTPTVWHLGTQIHGSLRDNTDMLELLYKLHPTPAVSGYPQQAALDFLARHGVFDRGLFSGVIGWLDQRPGKPASCQWAMTLRCGVLAGSHAVAFAGAGIVSGSDPQDERMETTAKLTTFARALG